MPGHANVQSLVRCKESCDDGCRECASFSEMLEFTIHFSNKTFLADLVHILSQGITQRLRDARSGVPVTTNVGKQEP